jgi:hypothetical protein
MRDIHETKDRSGTNQLTSLRSHELAGKRRWWRGGHLLARARPDLAARSECDELLVEICDVCRALADPRGHVAGAVNLERAETCMRAIGNACGSEKGVVVCGCRSGADADAGVCMRVSVGLLGECCASRCDIMRAPQKIFEVSAEWRLARCSAFATRTRCAAMTSTQNSQAIPPRCSD